MGYIKCSLCEILCKYLINSAFTAKTMRKLTEVLLSQILIFWKLHSLEMYQSLIFSILSYEILKVSDSQFLPQDRFKFSKFPFFSHFIIILQRLYVQPSQNFNKILKSKFWHFETKLRLKLSVTPAIKIS